MAFLPYLSTLVTFVFAFAVFNRYRQRGGLHLLLWAIGLLFYGLGTLSEVLLSLTFSAFLLKLWYLMGAMLTAAWLGQGTLHLLVRKGKVAFILTWILAAVSALAILLVLLAPVTGAAFDVTRPASEQYKDILTRDGLTITLTILLNIYGTLMLVGGAIYSAFLFWRKKVLANRMFGNILIAAGALSPALGGTFLKAGITDMLYASELVGAIIMYLGFMMSVSPNAMPETEPA
ncbi:MAG: hypothetical protein A3K45_02750 [Chloroflexi bacterium RIFOXYC12_FULL_59_14]|nr:MAG: hypothetical protein A3K45_02750 [Chloroflexi bacterium RIFOXYC12_FULL_59_14]